MESYSCSMADRVGYVSDADAVFSAHNGREQDHLKGNSSTNNILRILCEAGDITKQEISFSSPIEPTPLGPHGVARVVRDIPLTDARWIPDNDRLSILLAPLLPQPDIFNRKRVLGNESNAAISDYPLFQEEADQESFYKRQRISIDLSDYNVTKKHRSALSSFHSSTSMTSSSSSSACEGDTLDSDPTKERFRAYQAEQWNERFADLKEFQMKNGHCLIPHNFPENSALSQWVKRQRYQFKLKMEGKHSTLTDERQGKLEAMGFIWDSHKAVWEEKFREMCLFRQKYGHANVPSNCHDKALAIWVKCQRRQYKLHQQGKKSSITPDRINKLELLEFVWNPRNL